MKKNISGLIIVLCIFIKVSYAQDNIIHEYKFKNEALINLLCSVDTSILKVNDNLAVRLYQISNISGSAKLEGSAEVSKKFVIAVSSVDDSPEQHVYAIGQFLYPKIIKFEESDRDKFRVIVEVGVKNHRRKVTINVSLAKVTIT